jgi:hypothetical protein
LTAEVYNVIGQNNAPYIPQGAYPIITTTVPNINFQWDGGSVLGGPAEDIIVRFTGSILSTTTQDISFLATADDGTKLYIDGVLIADDWFDKGGGGTISDPVSFTAGVPKTIELMYYENGGGASVNLYWDQSGSMEIIPSEAFTSQAPEILTIGAPTSLNVVDSATAVTVTWNAPTDGTRQPERYAISFSSDGGGWGIATGNVGDANALNTTITIDHSLLESLQPSGTVWSFYIRSDNDTLGLYSQNSNVVTLKIGKTQAEKDEEQAAIDAEKARQAAIAAEEARIAAEREAARLAEIARLAEEERIAIEKARQEAINAENARLAELARQAAIKAEQERLAAEKAAEEARIAAEIAAKEKAEAEAKAKAEAEAKAKAEAEEKARAEAEAKAKAEEEARIAAELKAKAEEEAKAEAERIAAELKAAKEAEAKLLEEKKAAEEARLKEEAEKAEAERLEAIANAAKEGKELSKEEVAAVVTSLIEDLKPGQSISAAQVQSSGVSYSDLPPETPIEVRTSESGEVLVITAEVAANVELVQDPGALLEAAFTDPGAALAAFGSIGADMTEGEREEATEMVVATVVAAGAAINAAAVAAGGATGGGGSGGGGSSGGGSGSNSPGSRGGRKW